MLQTCCHHWYDQASEEPHPGDLWNPPPPGPLFADMLDLWFFCLSSDETGGRCIDAVALAPPPSASSDPPNPQLLLRPPPLRFAPCYSLYHNSRSMLSRHSLLSPSSPSNLPPPLTHPTHHYTPQLPLLFTAKIALKNTKKQCCSLRSLSS